MFRSALFLICLGEGLHAQEAEIWTEEAIYAFAETK